MFPSFKNLFARYDRYMTMKGREEARLVLLNKSPRELEDIGISPYLLKKGVAAWPWSESSDNAQPTSVGSISISKEQRRAIKELRNMSNAELNDMGISRGSIVDAVKNGRSVDQRSQRAA